MSPQQTSAAPTTAPQLSDIHHPIRFETHYALIARLAGITPERSYATVDETDLLVRFGPWSVRTPLANIDSVDLTGPYFWPKVIGPPHLSLRDRGLTFAGNSRAGACIHFREPVAGVDPAGVLRAPALTVTVEQPEAFIDALRHRLPEGTLDDVDDAVAEIEQESHDELENMTAAELRDLARAEGISGVSKLNKPDLITRIEQHEDDIA